MHAHNLKPNDFPQHHGLILVAAADLNYPLACRILKEFCQANWLSQLAVCFSDWLSDTSPAHYETAQRSPTDPSGKTLKRGAWRRLTLNVYDQCNFISCKNTDTTESQHTRGITI